MTKFTDNWLGVPALAKELGVTLRTVYKLLDEGEITSYKILSRRFRLLSSLKTWRRPSNVR